MVPSKNWWGGGQWRHRNSFNRGILYCEVSGPKELLSEEIGVCHGIKAAIYSRLYPSKRQSLPLCTTWSVCLREWIPVLKQLFQKRDDEVEGENVSLKIWSRAVFAIHYSSHYQTFHRWCMVHGVTNLNLPIPGLWGLAPRSTVKSKVSVAIGQPTWTLI